MNEYIDPISQQEREDAIARSQADALEEAIGELVRTGTVAATARKYGDSLAAGALQELTERAPVEIAGSWPMVVAWSRMQRAYERADRIGDTDGMLKASKAQADMIRERYR